VIVEKTLLQNGYDSANFAVASVNCVNSDPLIIRQVTYCEVNVDRMRCYDYNVGWRDRG